MSKIEVDAITEQSGSTLTAGGGAGKTVVVDATTVTLGRCGGTVALASGASQTGFGRTGTVDWQHNSKNSRNIHCSIRRRIILQILQVELLTAEFTSRCCWSNSIGCRLRRYFSNK